MKIPVSSCKIQKKILLPRANEVWGKVMFLHLSVSLFTTGGSLYDVTSFLAARGRVSVWGSLSRGGVSVKGRGLCPGEGSLSRGGVSVQGRGLCPREGLCLGISVQRISV